MLKFKFTDRRKGGPQKCYDLQTLPNLLFVYPFDLFLFDYRYCNSLSGLRKGKIKVK